MAAYQLTKGVKLSTSNDLQYTVYTYDMYDISSRLLS